MSDFTGFLMSTPTEQRSPRGLFLPAKKSRRPVAEIVHNHPQALENFFLELSGFLHIGPLFTWPSQFCPFSEVTEKLKFEGACSLGRWMRRERKGREEKGRLQNDTVC